MDSASAAPVIVFGAFDRHNFGDLLFPHIVSALLPRHKLIFAGLAERDLREFGGHEVEALPALLRSWQGDPPVLLHAGGELLGCDVWEAAIMLQSHTRAQELIRRYAQASGQIAWANAYLEINDAAPYVVSPVHLPAGSRILYNAVGGVDLNAKPAGMREEVTAKLIAANAVGVRDKTSLQNLKQAGINAVLMPDPAALTAELFDTQIEARAAQDEVAAIRRSFPRGYLAIQFSADFGDDATLAVIEDQLRRLVEETQCGIVLFCAGAAPWHDDIDTYRRLATRFTYEELRIFQSLHLWDICALIANSRAYCGSSLHGRIVAMAYGLPRLNLVHAASLRPAGKQAAYAATWDSESSPAVTPPLQLYSSLMQAMSVPHTVRQHIARFCAAQHRSRFAQLCENAGL